MTRTLLWTLVALAYAAPLARACPCTGDPGLCSCLKCGCPAATQPVHTHAPEPEFAAPDKDGWQKCLRGPSVGWSFRRTRWAADGTALDGVWRDDATGVVVPQWPGPDPPGPYVPPWVPPDWLRQRRAPASPWPTYTPTRWSRFGFGGRGGGSC